MARQPTRQAQASHSLRPRKRQRQRNPPHNPRRRLAFGRPSPITHTGTNSSRGNLQWTLQQNRLGNLRRRELTSPSLCQSRNHLSRQPLRRQPPHRKVHSRERQQGPRRRLPRQRHPEHQLPSELLFILLPASLKSQTEEEN